MKHHTAYFYSLYHSLILILRYKIFLPLHIYLNHSMVRLEFPLAQLLSTPSVKGWKGTAIKMNDSYLCQHGYL